MADKRRISAQGCYVDDVVTRDLPTQILIRHLTVEACVSACASAAYKYAAVQVTFMYIATVRRHSSQHIIR